MPVPVPADMGCGRGPAAGSLQCRTPHSAQPRHLHRIPAPPHVAQSLRLAWTAAPGPFLLHHGCNPPPRGSQVDSIVDSTQALLADIAAGKEVPKADAENLAKKRKLIKPE